MEGRTQPRLLHSKTKQRKRYASELRRVKGEIESPSDIDGIVYVRMDEGGAWRQDLTQEMESAGLPIIKRSEVPF